MRVLLPIHSFLPHHQAGAEMYTAQLAHHLGREDEVTVATTRRIISLPSGTMRRTEHEGIRVIEVVNNCDFESVDETWSSRVMEAAFEQVLDEVRPDLVHFQHLLYWSAGAPAQVKRRGLPCLSTLHDFWHACARMGQLIDSGDRLCAGPSAERCAPCMAATVHGQDPRARRWIRRLIAIRRWTGLALDEPLRQLKSVLDRRSSGPAAVAELSASDLAEWRGVYERRVAAFGAAAESIDLFISPSRDLRRRFLEWGLPEEKIVWLPHGLDHEPFRAATPRSRRDGEPLRLGFLGTVAAHKAPHLLIEAVSGLPADRVHLSIWGPEYQQPAYADRCRELARDLPNVELGGFLAPERVPEALGSIDALCVPSLWYECSPLTILEAQIARVPCLVSRLGGMADLVTDGVDGLHVEAGSVEDWRRAMSSLLEDPALATRLGAQSPEVLTAEEHARRVRRHWNDLRAA